ncbi:MAG: hypothetical protein AB7K24_14280 [Gemmataceae bacterium]
MTPEPADRQQQKMREFMGLLPLTLAIAGLPDAQHGQHYNEGQMDARATTIKHAFKVARQLVLEAVK